MEFLLSVVLLKASGHDANHLLKAYLIKMI